MACHQCPERHRREHHPGDEELQTDSRLVLQNRLVVSSPRARFEKDDEDGEQEERWDQKPQQNVALAARGFDEFFPEHWTDDRQPRVLRVKTLRIVFAEKARVLAAIHDATDAA